MKAILLIYTLMTTEIKIISTKECSLVIIETFDEGRNFVEYQFRYRKNNLVYILTEDFKLISVDTIESVNQQGEAKSVELLSEQEINSLTNKIEVIGDIKHFIKLRPEINEFKFEEDEYHLEVYGELSIPSKEFDIMDLKSIFPLRFNAVFQNEFLLYGALIKCVNNEPKIELELYKVKKIEETIIPDYYFDSYKNAIK